MALRSAFTTGGPSVMLGTKWPSITSTWTAPAPPRSAAAISLGQAAEVRGQDRGGEDHCAALLTSRLTDAARLTR